MQEWKITDQVVFLEKWQDWAKAFVPLNFTRVFADIIWTATAHKAIFQEINFDIVYIILRVYILNTFFNMITGWLLVGFMYKKISEQSGALCGLCETAELQPFCLVSFCIYVAYSLLIAQSSSCWVTHLNIQYTTYFVSKFAALFLSLCVIYLFTF